MLSYIDLTNAMVAMLQAIPQLVADLANQSPDSIIGYIDVQPTRNTVAAAIYSQPPGTVIVVWDETMLTEGEMSMWLHRVKFYLRAQRDQSVYTLIEDIMNGAPVPGDGQRWRYCPVMAGLDPTQVMRIARETDPEQIDIIVIETETKETGDA
jgi:hypothetical protein